MGNAHTLAMIAAASAKLKRIDPDYLSNIAQDRTEKRREGRLQKIRQAALEYKTDHQRLVVRNNALIDHEYEPSVGDLQMQDNILFDLAGIDSGRAAKKVEVNAQSVRVYSHEGHTLTILQWSEHTGVKPATIRHRLNSGFSIREAIDISKPENDRRKKPHSHINFKPKPAATYTNAGNTMTLKAWSVATGIKVATIKSRLAKGWTLDDTLTIPLAVRNLPSSYQTTRKQQEPRFKRQYAYAGQMKTLDEWAIFTGINVGTLRTRLQVGWSMHRVITSKLNAKSGYKGSGSMSEPTGGWSETLNNSAAKDRPHSLDIQPKQEIFQ